MSSRRRPAKWSGCYLDADRKWRVVLATLFSRCRLCDSQAHFARAREEATVELRQQHVFVIQMWCHKRPRKEPARESFPVKGSLLCASRYRDLNVCRPLLTIVLQNAQVASNPQGGG